MVFLFNKNNFKFLVIIIDCLQFLVYGNQESKLIILVNGGFQVFVQIMCNYSYEKLFWIISCVFKVLFVCFSNKFVIVEVGGMQVLGKYLISNSFCLVQNCLWILCNFLDVVIKQEGLESVLKILVNQLSVDDVNVFICVMGIFFNLICNNSKNKMLVIQNSGVEVFIYVILCVGDKDDIMEFVVCVLCYFISCYFEVEMVQNFVCFNYGILVIVKLFNQFNQWLLVKVIIGLIRNLVLCLVNYVLLQEVVVIFCFV